MKIDVEQNSKLCVVVLGHQNSGKSWTWEKLFGKTIRTGKYSRNLVLFPTATQLATASTDGVFIVNGSVEERGKEIEDVFVVSGSVEERGEEIEEVVPSALPNIILCSVQYSEHAIQTIDWLRDQGYKIHIYWLNPGYKNCLSGGVQYFDNLGLVPRFLSNSDTISIFDASEGNKNRERRVNEIRELIYGWAFARNLIKP